MGCHRRQRHYWSRRYSEDCQRADERLLKMKPELDAIADRIATLERLLTADAELRMRTGTAGR